MYLYSAPLGKKFIEPRVPTSAFATLLGYISAHYPHFQTKPSAYSCSDLFRVNEEHLNNSFQVSPHIPNWI